MAKQTEKPRTLARQWMSGRLSLEQQRAITGYLFVMPFLVGFVFFFLYPFLQSIIFSLNELEVTRSGYVLHYVGLENYRSALLVHPTFTRILIETVGKTLADLPSIIIFSFFSASLLNQSFRGRSLARMMFFLPVILASGAIARMEQIDFMHALLTQGSDAAEGFMLGGAVRGALAQLRLPEFLLDYVITAVDHIPQIINASGIPILIFLAGLQTIPSSLYEASSIEGASPLDNFWKVTIPMISPLMLTNIVYIIVDSFTRPGNEVIQLILDGAWGTLGYGLSTAMAWLYFAGVAVILAVSMAIVSRRVFYQE